MWTHARASLVTIGVAAALTAGASAQPATTDPDPVRAEELRRVVELAIADALRPQPRGDIQVDRFVAAALELARRGPEVVPALSAEIGQTLPGSYFFCAYALGLVGGPAAAAALDSAVARAEVEAGDFALNRKGWACHSLGLLGRADALDLLNEGQHKAAGIPVHAGTSALEAIAVLTAPAGLPLLHAQLARYTDEDDPNAAQRVMVVQAIARIGDPSSLPVLKQALESPRVALRHHTARAVGQLRTPEAAGVLLGLLADPEPYVRQGAGVGLENAPPVGRVGEVLTRLDEETDAVVRGTLYRVVARHGTAADLARLATYAGRPDAEDRRHLLRALAEAPADVALPILVQGLSDPSQAVSVIAATSLQRLSDRGAVEPLARIVASVHWSPAQAAIDALAALGDPRGAPAISHRLLDVELPQPITDPRQRLRIEKLLLALVELRDTSRLAELHAARDGSSDAQVRELLTRHIARLDTIERAGTKAKRWIAELESSNADVRLLAYAALGRAGGEASARALVERFGRVDPEEAREILRALGSIPGPAAEQLVRRVLVDPTFDPADRSELRDMAAWSARCIGGAAMLSALQEAVARRDGRDGRPFLYLAVLSGARVIPEIDRLRAPRLRYLGSTRGAEDERLQWVRRELTAGRSIARLDVPPERLDLR